MQNSYFFCNFEADNYKKGTHDTINDGLRQGGRGL